MNWLKRFLKFREKQHDGELVKPFLEHMEDLRWTLIKIIGTLVVGMIASFYFVDRLKNVMKAPLVRVDPDAAAHLQVLSPTEPFMVSLTMAFFAGMVLTFPVLLYFLAEFILPALTKREKKVIIPGIGVAFLLFVGGVVLCYFAILPQTLRFFHDYALKMGADSHWRLGDYFSFVTHLTLAFGILCEVPVVMMVLAALGLVSYALLSRTRMYAYVIVLFLTAFIAPTPDPITFLCLSFPVILLYELCIWLVWLLERRRARREVLQEDHAD